MKRQRKRRMVGKHRVEMKCTSTMGSHMRSEGMFVRKEEKEKENLTKHRDI